MLLGLFGGKKGSAKPTVKDVLTCIRLPDKSVLWKEAKKELKRVLPYITDEELDVVKERFQENGEIRIRLSSPETKLFKAIKTDSRPVKIVKREDFDCCGEGHVCDFDCARKVGSSQYMTATDLGLIPNYGDLKVGDLEVEDDSSPAFREVY